MATMLETYQKQKTNFESKLAIAMPSPLQIMAQQEIIYRIGVLEACQLFVATAPKNADIQTLLPHYQIVD